MTNIKEKMKGLELMTARSRSNADDGQPATGRNLMTGIINQTGQDLRSRIRTLEEQVERYQSLEKTGWLEISIPLDNIDRPDLVMRSAHYWSTDRYREIRESIRQNGLKDPITVRPGQKQGRYTLVKGDTRLYAHQELLAETGDTSWGEIRARVETLDEEMAILSMVIENRDREDVCPYDQAVFYSRVLSEVFCGDMTATTELLNISKGWLSRNATVAELPETVMEAFPSLYQAGMRVLYPLAKAVVTHRERLPEILEQAETLRENSPVVQADRLVRVLEAAPKRKPAPRTRQQLTAPDGQVVAEISKSRTHDSLRIDRRAMPGFAEMLESRLTDLYDEWKKNQLESQSENVS